MSLILSKKSRPYQIDLLTALKSHCRHFTAQFLLLARSAPNLSFPNDETDGCPPKSIFRLDNPHRPDERAAFAHKGKQTICIFSHIRKMSHNLSLLTVVSGTQLQRETKSLLFFLAEGWSHLATSFTYSQFPSFAGFFALSRCRNKNQQQRNLLSQDEQHK